MELGLHDISDQFKFLHVIVIQVCEAVNTISDVAQGKVTSGISTFEGTGELAAALDDFDEQIIINPLTYEEHKYRPSLEERLESIISGAALMADSSCTRDERRERWKPLSSSNPDLINLSGSWLNATQ